MTFVYGPATDAASGFVLDAATVTWQLKDDAGLVVSSGSFTNDGSGNYSMIIDKAVTVLLTKGASYFVEATFTQGNYDDFRRIAKVAAYRGVK